MAQVSKVELFAAIGGTRGSTIIETGTRSYRLSQTRARQAASS